MLNFPSVSDAFGGEAVSTLPPHRLNFPSSHPVQERRELVAVSGSGNNVASIRGGGRESGNGLGGIVLCGFRGGVGGKVTKVGADNSLTRGDRSLVDKEADEI